jgi:uncharacterized membrane protein
MLELARLGTRYVFWTSMVALSALIVAETLPYFSFDARFAFLVEKGELVRETLWRTCFYAHIAGGVACLASGPLLVSALFLRRATSAHRVLGRLYVLAVLGCAGPAGLYMALHARGGALGTLGFAVLGALWIATTALGVADVLRGRIASHRRWMVRSYALALSAVFFRVAQLALYALGAGDDWNYVVSLWLSLALSVYAGEVLARSNAAASLARASEAVTT